MSSPTLILGQLRAIRNGVISTAQKRENVHYTLCNSLNNVRDLMMQGLSDDLSKSVKVFTSPIQGSTGQPPYPESGEVALFLCDQLIELVKPYAERSRVEDRSPTTISRIAPESKSVFIVHGHDEANLLRLKAMLKDRFDLNPIVLMDEASSGETVIEKFERLAAEAAYCIVLMTPDDQIASISGGVAQARPNVIFELGWFYGRLGRSRVCILMKRGTAIHSDLAGIVRVEFIERVEEAVPNLERELGKAGF